MSDSYDDHVCKQVNKCPIYKSTYCKKHTGFWRHECGCEELEKAWRSCGGEWPRKLRSGIMFYNGRRITKKQFEEFGKGTK